MKNDSINAKFNFDSRRLESLLEAVDAAVITIDSQGKVLEVNTATTRLFGYDYESIVGQNVKMLMPSSYRVEHDTYLENHRNTGVNRIIGKGRRVEGRREDGKVFPIHLSVAHFVENDQSYYTGIIHDLTELTQAEATSLKLHRIIDECINEVYTFHHDSLKISWVNHEARRNLNYTISELADLTPIDLVANLTKEALSISMDRLQNNEIRFLEFEESFVRKDGSQYDVQVQLYYLDELDPPEYAVVAMDVTDRNKMMDALRQSQKMESIGSLSGGIAHDFNNILTVILGNTELLQLEERNGSDNDLLNEVSTAAQMGARLTERLLGFARKKPLSSEVISLNDLVSGLEEMLSRSLDAQVDLLLSLSETDLPVTVDASEAENAIVNLVVNAKDAMPAGGRIVIESNAVSLDRPTADSMNIDSGNYACLKISDTGTGIDQALKPKIFEPFVTTKESTHGTGLGLSMVYGFVKQSRGHINCYSEPGKGTTFNIYLPRVNQEHVAVSSPNEEKAIQPGKRYTVLVAEDEDSVRKLTVRRFQMLGYTVVEASDGFKALERFKDTPDIDFVFSDVVMTQGMTGYDLAVEIKKLNANIPILLTSGYAEDVVNSEKLKAAGLKLLRKPFEQSDLLTILDELLG